MINFLSTNFEYIIGVFVSIIAYFGGRKSKKADETKNTSDALTSMQQTYDTWVNDFKNRYDELKSELKLYREEQLQLRKEITQLRNENDELRKELRVWEQKYTKLKKEFDNTQEKNG